MSFRRLTEEQILQLYISSCKDISFVWIDDEAYNRGDDMQFYITEVADVMGNV
jgi:hypothetical protein